MRIFLFSILTMFSFTAVADEFYEEFQGQFISDKGGDCKAGRRYELRYDSKGDRVVLTRKGESTEAIVVPGTGATTYRVDPKSHVLTITAPHLALDESEDSQEVRFGEEGGKSIYVHIKEVQLDKDLQGNDDEQFFTHIELNLSKDRKTLTYYYEKNDFISDPHQTMCVFQRVEEK